MKHLKHSVILLITLSLQIGRAQPTGPQGSCGTGNPSGRWEKAFQKLAEQQDNGQAGNKAQQSYVIPVIFHIIHGGQPVGTYPNVPQSMINAQITTLNNDFAGTGYYTASYPANAFAAWAATANVSPASLDASGRVAIANCNIEFCLATQDTNGNTLAEPGIERINYNSMGWSNPAGNTYSTLPSFFSLYENIIKPQTIWDVTKYLNIWVSDNSQLLGIAGFATYPYLSTLNDLPPSSMGTATTDGVFCHAFSIGYASHIASHEIGHWLGLWHTWGDSPCGNDYCNDTPPAPMPSSGSPNYPYNVNACSGSGNGVMFMNYMDYADPGAQYMFTQDQANRMQTAMANSPYRKFLGTHNLCSVQNVPVVADFALPNTICTSKTLTLLNESFGWPAPTSFTWSASGGTFYPGPQVMSPSIQFPAPGVFTISLATTNGTLNVYTRTITVTSPSLFFSSTTQSICQGAAASFTVDGVSTYTWQPGSIVGPVVSFTPAASQSYTCLGMEVNNCSSTGIVDVVVSSCTGMEAYSSEKQELRVYPNPACQTLWLELSGHANTAADLQISDAAGRIIRREKAADSQRLSINISALEPGMYIVKVRSAGGTVTSGKFVKEN